jgi:hypothetical protein
MQNQTREARESRLREKLKCEKNLLLPQSVEEDVFMDPIKQQVS